MAIDAEPLTRDSDGCHSVYWSARALHILMIRDHSQLTVIDTLYINLLSCIYGLCTFLHCVTLLGHDFNIELINVGPH